MNPLSEDEQKEQEKFVELFKKINISEGVRDKAIGVNQACLKATHELHEAAGIRFSKIREMSEEIYKWYETQDEDHIRRMMEIGAPYFRKLLSLTYTPNKTLKPFHEDGRSLLDDMKMSNEEFGELITLAFKCYQTVEKSDIEELLKKLIKYFENWEQAHEHSTKRKEP